MGRTTYLRELASHLNYVLVCLEEEGDIDFSKHH